ncbi:MAG: hypothetical protein KTR32_20675, partial [Granulosicoccus sp.]|nr:hypothetical protein [Granulosicoccus sp.]
MLKSPTSACVICLLIGFTNLAMSDSFPTSGEEWVESVADKVTNINTEELKKLADDNPSVELIDVR